METVLRPDILQTYSGPCEQSNDIFYGENGEELYNNQIFSRWGGESLVVPPELHSMLDPGYDGLLYTDEQNYNGNIRILSKIIAESSRSKWLLSFIQELNSSSHLGQASCPTPIHFSLIIISFSTWHSRI